MLYYILMKRLLYVLLGSLVGLPVMAQAFDLTFDPGGILKSKSKLGNQNPGYIAFTLVNFSLVFLGSITVIMIIVAGFMWIFAAGEEEKITKAKDLLKGSVLGLVIVLSSYGLATFVFSLIQSAVVGL